MSFLRILIGFLLGLPFLILGVIALVTVRHWSALFLVAMGLVLIPPVRLLLYRWTGRELSPVARTFVVTLLLALFVITFGAFAPEIATLRSAPPTGTTGG